MHRGEAVSSPLAEERRVGELAVAMDDVEIPETGAKCLQLQSFQDGRDARCNAAILTFQARKARIFADAR
jgi:hypothetical protein